MADSPRLPATVVPVHYDLTIQTDLDAKMFFGVIETKVIIKESTSTIVLNSSGLSLGNITIWVSEDQVLIPVTRSEDKINERLALVFPETFTAGSEAHLRISFKRELRTFVGGYFVSEYAPGKLHSVTLLCAAFARRVFPCWDEPALKATIQLSMISRQDTVNISNMPAEYEESIDLADIAGDDIFPGSADNGGWKITYFASTPKMSTYLLAFANGDLKRVESSYISPISGLRRHIGVYATPNLIQNSQFCLDILTRATPIYETLFNIEYPLPKLDVLTVQNYTGGMENWGLIVCDVRSSNVSASTDLDGKKIAALVLAHEVAHQWFGDITTSEWWDTIYLNEGFASWASEIAVAPLLYPDYGVEDDFLRRRLNNAFGLDAKSSSHPVEVPINDVALINQVFDGLSYSKAASVLQMLSEHIGQKTFLRGVSLYLRDHLYGNAQSVDLWNGVSLASGLDVAAIMDPWITKSGFPLVTIEETSSLKEGLTVRQSRFLEEGKSSEDEDVWPIPLSIVVQKEDGKVATLREIVDKKENFIPLSLKTFVKVNAESSGFYRTLYTTERVKKIAELVKSGSSVISRKDRCGMVFDLMSLGKAGSTPLSTGLGFIDQISGAEDTLVAMNAIATSLQDVVDIWWEDDDAVNQLNAFRSDIFSPLLDKLGLEPLPDDSPNTLSLRMLVVDQLLKADNERLAADLKSRFDHFKETGEMSKIPADLGPAAFMAGVKYGDQKAYEFMRKLLKENKVPISRSPFIKSLCAPTDPKIIQSILDFVLSEESALPDWFYYFRALSMNLKARRMLADFTAKNFDALHSRPSDGGLLGTFILESIVNDSFGRLTTKEDRDFVEKLFKDKDTANYSRALAYTMSAISGSISFIERSNDDLHKWLESRK